MKKFIYLLLLLPVLAMAQSEDQNYVRTLVYKEATATSDLSKAHANVTYYDGLGRPIQQVAGKMSASGMDIITHIEYDAFGREIKKYLPYPTQRATLEFDDAAQTNTFTHYNTAYGDAYPYSESFLEPSPLGRVLKQSAPGAPWKGNQNDNNDKTVKFSHQVNGANEVKKFKAHAEWFQSRSIYNISFSATGLDYYTAGQLYKTVTKDENWTSGTNHTTEEFKNKDGQVVLKRTYIDGIKADTYYVYDEFGNLTYVLPPKAQGEITYLEDLCYQYKYDKRNRLVEKKLPGKQWEFIVYDSQDRVMLTGPTLIPFGGSTSTSVEQGWLRTYYDAFGRVAFTGWYYFTVNAITRSTLQNLNNGVPVYAVRGSGTINNIPVNYTPPTGLSTVFRLLTVNYYDDYLWLPTADRPTSSTQVEGAQVSLNTKGLLTGSWVRALEGASSTAGETTYSYYDYRGRALRTKATNYLGGYTQVDSKLDFTGKVQYTKTQFKKGSTGIPLTISENFEYSDQDRILSHMHSIGNVTIQQLSANTYNELGQLISKRIGGSLNTYQKVDYKYNIRGWLTDINDVDNLEIEETDAPQDLFAYRISYNTIGDNLNNRISPLYNGNIAETKWISAQDNVLRKYSYKYDSANRLKDAYYQKPGQAVPESGSYNESIAYDMNGNITSMQRTGGVDDANTVVEIDELEYFYENSNSNRLTKVIDHSTSPQGFKDVNTANADYTYDGNGNMLTDLNKGITSIKYNHLNLPVEIIFNNNSSKKITYLYNAAGVKLKKTVVDGASTVVIDYLSGFQYKNNVLQFFPTAEGYVDYTPIANTVGEGTYNYVYQYKDHLGNVRMNYAYSPPFKTDPGGVRVKDESHYYPFGLRHLNYNMDYLEYKEIEDEIVLYPPVSTGGKLMYNYKYNGKELQDELGLNMYDYGARNYDPALGRWMNIDPLAEKRYDFNPYMYAADNPIVFIDPDGMDFKLTGSAAQDFFRGLLEDLDQVNKNGGEVRIDANSGERSIIDSWMPLNKSTLYNYVKSNFCEDCSRGKVNEMAGTKFENAFHRSMRLQLSQNNYKPNILKQKGSYKEKDRNVVPDGVFDLLVNEKLKITTRFGVIKTPIPTGNILRFPGIQSAEVKAMDGTLYSSTNQGQLSGMITAMGANTAIKEYGGEFLFGTTADTGISSSLMATAVSNNITIVHLTAQYKMTSSGAMEVNFFHEFAPSGFPTTLK